jgi:DNA invertase Pin-like site-specific DNA recombinase
VIDIANPPIQHLRDLFGAAPLLWKRSRDPEIPEFLRDSDDAGGDEAVLCVACGGGLSMRHLIDLVEELRQRGIGFKSLCEGVIDTTTASGELVFHIFTALAQFERRLIQERARAGLESARARERLGGRKPIPAGHEFVIENYPRVRCLPRLAQSNSPRSTSEWMIARQYILSARARIWILQRDHQIG